MKIIKVLYLVIVLGLCLAACREKQVAKNLFPQELEQEGMSLTTTGMPESTSEIKPNTSPIKQLPDEKQSKLINEVICGTAWEWGNSQGNLLAQGFICESEGKIYYQDFNHDKNLCMMNVDGTGKEVLAKVIPRSIQVVGEYVYYIDNDKNSDTYNRIMRVPKVGGRMEVLGEERVGTMLVAKEEIYFTGGDYIAKMGIDGSDTQVILNEKGSGDFGWFGIYGDCIITGGVLNGTKILGVKLDGSEETLLYQGYTFPQIEGDRLYCSNERGEMTAISITTGEQKSWEKTYGNRSVCHGESLYFTNGSQLCAIDMGSDSVSVIYPIEEKEDATPIELYGVVCDYLFFTEAERQETGESRVIFKYIDLETMDVVVVP